MDTPNVRRRLCLKPPAQEWSGHQAGGSRNPTRPHENGGSYAADPAEQHLALGRLDAHDGTLVALAKHLRLRRDLCYAPAELGHFALRLEA